jgi:hypothetical protein
MPASSPPLKGLWESHNSNKYQTSIGTLYGGLYTRGACQHNSKIYRDSSDFVAVGKQWFCIQKKNIL